MACNICETCFDKENCDGNCAALTALKKVCNEQITADKVELIREYAHDLDLIYYEIANDLKELGETLIAALPELYVARNYSPKIGYLRSYEAKKSKGKTINAECRIIKGVYTAYLPFDFVITFFQPSVECMTDNQIKILMLHELRHVGVDKAGFTLVPHDIEDFTDILTRYGLRWDELNQDVPDILDNASSI